MSRDYNLGLNHLSLAEAMIQVMQQFHPQFPAAEVRAQLQQLSDEAWAFVGEQSTAEQRLKLLLQLFYQHWGFESASGKYRLSEVIWLDQVLETRRGSAVSLGAILLYLAQQLQVDLQPLIFPTQLLLTTTEYADKETVINPFTGDSLAAETLDAWIIGTLGLGNQFDRQHQQPATTDEVIHRLLETLKAALMEEQQMELALQVNHYLLTMKPEDPYEIRDRGLIYAQLQCQHIAVNDLSYFVDQCPEDPVSEMIKIQLHSLEQQSIILH